MRGSIVVMCVTLVSVGGLSAAPVKDPFPVGAVWEGTRAFKGQEGVSQEWSLKITDRKGQDFKGEITLSTPNGPMTCPVSGSTQVPSGFAGKLTFQSERKGQFRQSFEGTYRTDEVRVLFHGTGFNGKEVSGTAVLYTPDRSRQVKEANARAEKRLALLTEASKLSQAELQQRLRSNPRRTPEDRERYVADITAYHWAKDREREKNKTPEQRERDRLLGLFIMAALSQGGSGPSGDAAADEERQRKKVQELEEKFRREAEAERERQRRERDR